MKYFCITFPVPFHSRIINFIRAYERGVFKLLVCSKETVLSGQSLLKIRGKTLDILGAVSLLSGSVALTRIGMVCIFSVKKDTE